MKKNFYLIVLLIASGTFACGGKKNNNQGNIKTDTTSVNQEANNQQNHSSPVKIYQGVELDKSKYPDDLYVVMPDEIRSSGYLTGENEDYKNEYMIDHDPYTWWSPNPNRNGQGAWIELVFGTEVPMEGFEIWGGSHNPAYPKYGDIYKLNNRVKKGVCEFSDGSQISFELKDVDAWQWVKFDKTIKTKSIKLRINEVYKGDKWDDLCIAEFLALTSDESLAYYGEDVAKPVIYLYPEHTMDVNVQLDTYRMNGSLDVTYPAYTETGWNVTASPDGKLVEKESGKIYHYLFWEGSSLKQWKFEDGFVVKGSETAAFLEEKLSEMGLLPNEYNDFIVYWLPLMIKNKYNLIRFPNDEYTRDVPLLVEPQPTTILRVFMVFKPLDIPIEIPQQKLNKCKRNGFTLVEWGGTAITNSGSVDL
jgi:hypothetical protein